MFHEGGGNCCWDFSPRLETMDPVKDFSRATAVNFAVGNWGEDFVDISGGVSTEAILC